ncbi:DUF1127 domain-containing protein [Paucibacter sp. AS339]|uniref:DUF1127 domain-containing protein n=1 Tax=Paucibacter hankyongi TaxID=3133434 RepID=UPI003096D4BF
MLQSQGTTARSCATFSPSFVAALAQTPATASRSSLLPGALRQRFERLLRELEQVRHERRMRAELRAMNARDLSDLGIGQGEVDELLAQAGTNHKAGR